MFFNSDQQNDQQIPSGSGERQSNTYHDETHGSSGSEDEGTEKESDTKSKRREVPSNDDLLYDPDLDDEDEEWVRKQREKNRGRGKSHFIRYQYILNLDLGVLHYPDLESTDVEWIRSGTYKE